MENTLIKVDPKEFGLEEHKANELTIGLKNILEERQVLSDAYSDVIQLEITEENLSTFRELRLKIRDNRTKGIEKWHKVNKEFFLTGGRFVDAIKNKEVSENERMEEQLLKAEKHFEALEKERLLVVHNERVAQLIPFNYEIGNIDFSAMDDNMFNAILTGAKKNHEDKVEAEKKAEAERLEAIRLAEEEKEKQRLELERLRVENEAKEKQLEQERLEAEKIRLAEKQKADAELAEQKRLADIEAKKQAEIIAKQKEVADRLEKELKAKADAELKEKQRIEAEVKAKLEAEKKAAKAPDKDKLKEYIVSIDPKMNFDLKTMEAAKVLGEINVKLAAFKTWAKQQIESL